MQLYLRDPAGNLVEIDCVGANELPEELRHYVAEKGSIAVDGTSLTVAAVGEHATTFTVALIPHTLERTVARHYAPGRLVNLEVDVVARYVERLMKNGAVG